MAEAQRLELEKRKIEIEEKRVEHSFKVESERTKVELAQIEASKMQSKIMFKRMTVLENLNKNQ